MVPVPSGGSGMHTVVAENQTSPGACTWPHHWPHQWPHQWPLLPSDLWHSLFIYSFIHSLIRQGAWHSWERGGNLSLNWKPAVSRKGEAALSSHWARRTVCWACAVVGIWPQALPPQNVVHRQASCWSIMGQILGLSPDLSNQVCMHLACSPRDSSAHLSCRGTAVMKDLAPGDGRRSNFCTSCSFCLSPTLLYGWRIYTSPTSASPFLCNHELCEQSPDWSQTAWVHGPLTY